VLSAEHAHVNQIGVLQDAEGSKLSRTRRRQRRSRGNVSEQLSAQETVSADLYVRPCQGMVFSGEGRDDEQQDS
jgi:hypothetical protein